jgi:hypothetical protein
MISERIKSDLSDMVEKTFKLGLKLYKMRKNVAKLNFNYSK